MFYYSYTVSLTADENVFRETCVQIEKNIEGIQECSDCPEHTFGDIKKIYSVNSDKIVVYIDNEVDAVYVDSDICLSSFLKVVTDDSLMTIDAMKYIVSRLVERAYDSVEEKRKNKGELFYAGHTLAYYEVLDILKSELRVREQDLSEYGLDINLEKTFI